MTKMEIVTKMIENGYHMMGRTPEWFVENFSEETLENFLEKFLASKKNK